MVKPDDRPEASSTAPRRPGRGWASGVVVFVGIGRAGSGPSPTVTVVISQRERQHLNQRCQSSRGKDSIGGPAGST